MWGWGRLVRMELESIPVKNYKSLHNIQLKDIPKFLLIVGANGWVICAPWRSHWV